MSELITDSDPFSLNTLRINDTSGVDRSFDIIENVVQAQYSLSSRGTTELHFSVYDPELSMENNGFFQIRGELEFNNQLFEIASVDIDYKSTIIAQIVARPKGVQRLRRDKSIFVQNNLSVANFAQAAANMAELEFVGETPTAPNEGVIQGGTSDQDENVWGTLASYASNYEFEFFEAKGILYFASQRHILENSFILETNTIEPENFGQIVTRGDVAFTGLRQFNTNTSTGATENYIGTINIPYEENEGLYPFAFKIRRSDDARSNAQLTMSLRRTPLAVSLSPGVGLRFNGLTYFGMTFMINGVQIPMSPSAPVTITAVSVEGLAETSPTIASAASPPAIRTETVETRRIDPPTGEVTIAQILNNAQTVPGALGALSQSAASLGTGNYSNPRPNVYIHRRSDVVRDNVGNRSKNDRMFVVLHTLSDQEYQCNPGDAEKYIDFRLSDTRNSGGFHAVVDVNGIFEIANPDNIETYHAGRNGNKGIGIAFACTSEHLANIPSSQKVTMFKHINNYLNYRRYTSNVISRTHPIGDFSGGPITTQGFYGHSQLTSRSSDPGSQFDWNLFIQVVSGEYGALERGVPTEVHFL